MGECAGKTAGAAISRVTPRASDVADRLVKPAQPTGAHPLDLMSTTTTTINKTKVLIYQLHSHTEYQKSLG